MSFKRSCNGLGQFNQTPQSVTTFTNNYPQSVTTYSINYPQYVTFMIIFASQTNNINKMFRRDILQELKKWAAKSNRKPVVLMGARQERKTLAAKKKW